MATEKLIVELDAKTAKLDAGLDKTQKKLKGIDGATAKADKSFAKFTTGAKVAAAAMVAVAASIATAVKEAAAFAKELEIAANRAGETVERMQALSFATNTVGVSLEKLGDISKDTNEKIGEFLATGGGGFQDFADIMNLSASEARLAAQEFETLSGPEVLQEMVKRMEAAGVSANQMSFALEGMASNTTDLIPLLTNGAEELNKLTNEFDELGITISQADITKIKNVGQELDKMTSIFSAEGKQLIADYSEELIAVINGTVWLAQKTTAAFNVITTGLGNLIELSKAAFSDLIDGTDTFDQVLLERAEKTKRVLNDLLGEDMYDVRDAAAEKSAENILRITITKGKKLSAWERLNEKQKLQFKKDSFKAASDINSLLFNDNKNVARGLIIAETAQNVVTSVKNSGGIPWGIPAGISAAAMGITQLASLDSSSKDGGGAISSGGGSSSSTPTISAPVVEDQETSDLELSSRGTANQDIVIRFATDTGDELLDALAGGLNELNRRGG